MLYQICKDSIAVDTELSTRAWGAAPRRLSCRRWHCFAPLQFNHPQH